MIVLKLCKEGKETRVSEGRAKKLVRLSAYMNLETGTLYDEENFQDEFTLMDKGTQMKVIASRIRACKKCPGLNKKRLTEAIPGAGNLNADIFFLGQSLHGPGMVSEIPFVGGSGLLIIAALKLSRLERHDCYWTNIVHCHPENNRPSTEREKKNCLVYVQKELDIVKPKLLVLLGRDAKEAAIEVPEGTKVHKVKHPSAILRDGVPESISDFVVKLSLAIDGAIK